MVHEKPKATFAILQMRDSGALPQCVITGKSNLCVKFDRRH